VYNRPGIGKLDSASSKNKELCQLNADHVIRSPLLYTNHIDETYYFIIQAARISEILYKYRLCDVY